MDSFELLYLIYLLLKGIKIAITTYLVGCGAGIGEALSYILVAIGL
ncbi:MAG: hypothetical protein Q4D21_03170 [Phascolarctobacterium sp.]|nr:hypothetical protein [Phascolarctobacterium sp.]